MSRSKLLALLTAAAVAFVSAVPADAQGFGDRLKKKAEEAAKRKAEERVVKKAGDAADAALDKAENSVKCAATDQACIDKANQEGKTVVTDDGSGGAAAAGGGAAVAGGDANALKPGQGAWANYDFKPGDRVLYYDDFMKDEVGDFPRRMEFQSGALETVEWQGKRWLRASEDSRFYLVLPEVLPERFTMEFDYAIPSGEVWISFGDENKRVQFGGDGSAAVMNSEARIQASGRSPDQNREKVRRARVLGDGKYMKVYLDDRRILNVPNADVGRANKILFYTDGHVEKPSLFGDFRVAAGGKKLYDALTEAGRVATQGIYFDIGSDRIRPESTPTLKEIGSMLTEHADLKLAIEGHTDNVGNAAANQTLSEKRAAAVKAALVSSFGADASRLEAKGLGATKPSASNDSAEGRQTNRRVELVKM
ncbi:MAG: OmpA family protein [Gemmatimonadota bacterium]|nr:OmpA family protein [Gemmatimonadota bacterium]